MGATDVADHPILPWVTDFTSPSSNLRDLSKSKFRLKKGDQQLDFTFQNSPNPHHITELFSDITFHVYLSRITPLSTLRRVVRERFVAAEYPPSMARIYAWTPDEAIPEFFTDPTIFVSRHKELGLDDLQVPAWCEGSAEEFVRWHRALLESDEVSRQLHDWVDITFGYKLSGEAAVEAKNVPLRGNKQSSRRSAFVQLFDRPHPKRMLGGGLREDGAEEAGEEEPEPETAKAEEETKEEEKEAEVVTNGDHVAENGDGESVATGEEVEASSPPPVVSIDYVAAVDYSIRNLHLLQEAASFDAVYTALEGCYLPIQSQPATSASDPYDDEEMVVDNPALTGAVPVATAEAVYHVDSLPEAPVSPALTPPPPPPPPTPLETLRLLQADDIFSLGCVIAEVFLGHPLFSSHTHHLYSLGEYLPSLSSIPLSIQRLIVPMIHREPSKRPTAAVLLQHPVFTADDAYAQVYNFISELRRQQSMFSHSPPPPPPPATATPSPPPPAIAGAGPSTSSSQSALSPPVNPYLLALNSSFAIPSDDIHTPPVRSSALMDMAMMTPPEFSPLALAVKEREREEREAAGDDEASEGLEESDEEDTQEEGKRSRLPSSAKADEPVTRQQLTLDWALDQLQALSSLPLPVYMLVLPHALSLTSHPELFIPSVALLSQLSAKLGPSLSTRHLAPTLHTLLLHVDNLDLQCELLSFSTLRTVYTQFSYQGGAKEYVSYCRNSLLSPNWRISEAASASLFTFLVEHLDLNSDLDQELGVRDVLLPILGRVGRGGSDVLLKLLVRLVPELSTGLVRSFLLPHCLRLIEKGASATSEHSKAELEAKLSCGLELLYAMLPDLPLATLQSLLSEPHALKGLLAGTSRGPLSVVNIRRLLRILLFIVVELSGENELARTVNVHGSTSALGLKNLRLILPLLPLFADFLALLVTRMDAMRDGGASPGQWDLAACYDFMRALYVGLCVTVGPTIVRKACASHTRIEGILAQGPPVTASKRRSGLVGVQNVFGAGQGVGGNGAADLTRSEELDRVIKHGVLGRVKRGGWEEREEKRVKERRERLLKARQEEGEVLTLGGVSEVHENWLGLQADDERAVVVQADDEASDDEEGEEGDERFVKISKPTSSTHSRQLLRAATVPATAAPQPSGSPAPRGFFSFLQSSASTSSIPLAMDMNEWWSVDTSNPFKWKGVVKQTLQPHSAPLTALYSHPSSALFITAARDEPVKVWSVGIGTGEVHAGRGVPRAQGQRDGGGAADGGGRGGGPLGRQLRRRPPRVGHRDRRLRPPVAVRRHAGGQEGGGQGGRRRHQRRCPAPRRGAADHLRVSIRGAALGAAGHVAGPPAPPGPAQRPRVGRVAAPGRGAGGGGGALRGEGGGGRVDRDGADDGRGDGDGRAHGRHPPAVEGARDGGGVAARGGRAAPAECGRGQGAGGVGRGGGGGGGRAAVHGVGRGGEERSGGGDGPHGGGGREGGSGGFELGERRGGVGREEEGHGQQAGDGGAEGQQEPRGAHHAGLHAQLPLHARGSGGREAHADVVDTLLQHHSHFTATQQDTNSTSPSGLQPLLSLGTPFLPTHRNNGGP